MTNPITDPNDPNYDPALDPEFMDRVDTGQPAPPSAVVGTGGTTENKDHDYAGTGMSAAELVALYGTNPDGSPRIEPVPDGPVCPAVSPSDYPFDTTTIPSGCSEPLSDECAAYYNKLYAPQE